MLNKLCTKFITVVVLQKLTFRAGKRIISSSVRIFQQVRPSLSLTPAAVAAAPTLGRRRRRRPPLPPPPQHDHRVHRGLVVVIQIRGRLGRSFGRESYCEALWNLRVREFAAKTAPHPKVTSEVTTNWGPASSMLPVSQSHSLKHAGRCVYREYADLTRG